MSGFDMMCIGAGIGFIAAVILNTVLRSARPDPISDDYDYTCG